MDCTLKVVTKTGTFELGKEMSNKSICHSGEGMTRNSENEKKRAGIVVQEMSLNKEI